MIAVRWALAPKNPWYVTVRVHMTCSFNLSVYGFLQLNSGSLYCESRHKIVSAAFKCNDKDYHMQELGLFLSKIHGCMSIQLTLKNFLKPM